MINFILEPGCSNENGRRIKIFSYLAPRKFVRGLSEKKARRGGRRDRATVPPLLRQ